MMIHSVEESSPATYCTLCFGRWRALQRDDDSRPGTMKSAEEWLTVDTDEQWGWLASLNPRHVPSLALKGPLTSSNSWTIGRSRQCDLVVNHPALSKVHCRIVRAPDGWAVEDHSRNGCWVNRAGTVASIAAADLAAHRKAVEEEYEERHGQELDAFQAVCDANEVTPGMDSEQLKRSMQAMDDARELLDNTLKELNDWRDAELAKPAKPTAALCHGDELSLTAPPSDGRIVAPEHSVAFGFQDLNVTAAKPPLGAGAVRARRSRGRVRQLRHHVGVRGDRTEAQMHKWWTRPTSPGHVSNDWAPPAPSSVSASVSANLSGSTSRGPGAGAGDSGRAPHGGGASLWDRPATSQAPVGGRGRGQRGAPAGVARGVPWQEDDEEPLPPWAMLMVDRLRAETNMARGEAVLEDELELDQDGRNKRAHGGVPGKGGLDPDSFLPDPPHRHAPPPLLLPNRRAQSSAPARARPSTSLGVTRMKTEDNRALLKYGCAKTSDSLTWYSDRLHHCSAALFRGSHPERKPNEVPLKSLAIRKWGSRIGRKAPLSWFDVDEPFRLTPAQQRKFGGLCLPPGDAQGDAARTVVARAVAARVANKHLRRQRERALLRELSANLPVWALRPTMGSDGQERGGRLWIWNPYVSDKVCTKYQLFEVDGYEINGKKPWQFAEEFARVGRLRFPEDNLPACKAKERELQSALTSRHKFIRDAQQLDARVARSHAMYNGWDDGNRERQSAYSDL